MTRRSIRKQCRAREAERDSFIAGPDPYLTSLMDMLDESQNEQECED